MDESALGEVLDLLEARLSRIQYLLHGDNTEENAVVPQAIVKPLATRLQSLERSMDTLCANSEVVKQLLHLREHST